MKRFLTGLLATAALWGAAVGTAKAAPLFEPGTTWSTLTTPHFRIYYTPVFAAKAAQVAKIAENAYAQLVPYMGVAPDGPTEVVLADGYDILNSTATDTPHRAVWLWMTPPNPDEGMWIGRYDAWIRLLFTHEFTHVLQFQHTPEAVKLVNSAAGGLLLSGLPTLPIDITLNLPSLLSEPPAFFIEGDAVYNESTFTPGGRANGGDFDMIRRMAFLDHRVPTLDQVWGRYLLNWPMDGYEYTWGTCFVQYMVETYGKDAPVKVLDAYGPAPWLGFDVACRRALGVGVQTIWDGMVKELGARYEKQQEAWAERQALADAPHSLHSKLPLPFRFPAARDVTTTGRYHRHPLWAADGHLLYGEALKNRLPHLIDDDLGGHRRIVMNKSTRSAVTLHGNRVYFETDTEDTPHRLSSFRDIFVYNLKTKKEQRLTHAARTFTPAISPDGRRIVAVVNGAGRTGLGIFDTHGKLLRKWRYDNNDFQFGNPVWSPNGRAIACAVWHDGSRDLYLVDPHTGGMTRLFKDPPVDFYPNFSPDSRYLVFTSDRSGTFDLYALDLFTGKLHQLTDVLGGAFDPAVSPDGKTLAFSNYTGRGYDIQTIPFEPAASPVVAAFTGPDPVVPVSDPPPNLKPYSISSYNPLPTLVPSTWFPVIGDDEWGKDLSIYSFWQDILQQHELTLIGGYGFNSQRLNYGFRYQNDQGPFEWAVAMNEYPNPSRYPTGSDPNNPVWADLWQWDKSASLSASFPGLRDPMFDSPPILGDNWTVGVRTEMIQDYALKPDNGNTVSPVNDHQAFPTALDQGNAYSVFAEWQSAHQMQFPYDYAPMSGHITTLGVEEGYQPQSDSKLFTRVWADHRFYQQMPWGHKQSLAVRANAGLLYGRNGEFYYSDWSAPFGYQPLSTVNRWDLTSASSYDTRYVMLRGYPFLLGNRELSLDLEYRFPLAEVERGWAGFPVFLDRLYGVAFIDSGFFWGLDPTQLFPGLADFKSGAGAELRAQTTMFGTVPIDVHAGVARGLTSGGEWEPNIGLGTTF